MDSGESMAGTQGNWPAESQERLTEAMLGLISTPTAPGVGLPTLLMRLEQGGLGGIVNSWIGTGPNQPISRNQLLAALSTHELERMAARAGMTTDRLVDELSQQLPDIVDRLTPDGRMPGSPAGGAESAGGAA